MKIIFLAIIIFIGCTRHRNNAPEAIHTTVYKVKSFALVNSDSVKYYNNLLQQIANPNIPAHNALLKYCEGLNLLTVGIHNKAITNFTDAAQLFAKQNNDNLLAFSYMGIGNCNKLTGNPDNAIRNYLKALIIFKKLNAATLLSACYGNIAETYQQKDDIANTRKYLTLAKQTEPYGSKTYITLLHFQANLFGMTSAFDSALQTDYTGIALAKKNNYKDKLSPFYDNIAHCYSLLSKYDSAEYYYKKCIYMDSLNGRLQLMADTYAQMVDLYGNKKEPQKMLAAANRAFALCDSTQFKRGKYDIYGGLNNYYTAVKDWQRVATIKDSMQAIYRQLINEETEARIARYHIEYETGEKEKLITKQQTNLQQATYITVIISVVALLLAVSIIALYKNYTTRKSIAVTAAIQQQKDQNTQAVFESEQTERIRIARDLHDSIGQKLSVLKMYLHNRENDAVKTPGLLDETIQEVRNISHNLLPEELNFGFVNALRSDIEKLEATDRFKINTSILNEPAFKNVPLLTSLNMVRVFRELLSNVVKHSQATVIDIQAGIQNNILQLQLQDDGIGLPKNAIAESKGIGWKNIFTRIAMLKGTITIENNIPQGTVIHINIPIA